MSRTALLLAVMAALTALALLSIAGHNSWAGPAMFELTRRHGLNVGDLLVLGIWAGAALCCWRLWRTSGRE